jgi:replicative DNA helicase
VLQDAERDIFAIADDQIRDSLKPIQNFVTPLLERLNNRKDGITGIRTGITELDELTNGLQKSDLIILAARPGVGKTSFALTIAANAAINFHQNVAFFSLEMDGVQLAQRLLCSQAQIDQSKLRNGYLNSDEKKKLIAAVSPIQQAPLYVDDNADLGIMELMSKARQLKRKGKLDLLIIDYLQLMKTGKEENRAVAIGAISRGLKILAKEMQIPVIALAQLSRKVEEKGRERPQLSDLRESGSIEQDADMVWFVERKFVQTHREEDKHTAELIVAKHRNGSVKDIPMTFIPEYTTFYDAAPEGDGGGEAYAYDDASDMGPTDFGSY